ncbi:hypothetical protein PPN31114_02202 [Pandoraea pneumonica]|uniref:DUF4148 domain-containing protein n=1 Tax=Pandoraea pneumonica TaxID=2508299 RepID=A0A5E4USX1_9BURK|nr:DUF4148 domain-containing protein [Pandoraea pneumonica]VVE02623.1 hypothetical protein PPN31114_02202 [Pandoraea pneumonica]
MKRTLITSALVSAMLAVSAGSAFASDAFEGPSEFAWVPQTSALSRAQVRTELIQAQQAGLLEQHDSVYPTTVAKVGGAAQPVMAGSVTNVASAGSTYFGS